MAIHLQEKTSQKIAENWTHESYAAGKASTAYDFDGVRDILITNIVPVPMTNYTRSGRDVYKRQVQIRPMTRNQNAREITFENPTQDPIEKLQNPGLGSYIKVSTAGSDGVGRGSTIRNVHISEYAFWPANTKKEVLTGILQAVPNEPKTFVAIESTANGFDHFKELWDQAVAGESGFTPLFFAWYELPEYTMPYDGFVLTEEEKQLQSAYSLTMDQLTWRRWCIKTNLSLIHILICRKLRSRKGKKYFYCAKQRTEIPLEEAGTVCAGCPLREYRQQTPLRKTPSRCV